MVLPDQKDAAVQQQSPYRPITLITPTAAMAPVDTYRNSRRVGASSSIDDTSITSLFGLAAGPKPCAGTAKDPRDLPTIGGESGSQVTICAAPYPFRACAPITRADKVRWKKQFHAPRALFHTTRTRNKKGREMTPVPGCRKGRPGTRLFREPEQGQFCP